MWETHESSILSLVSDVCNAAYLYTMICVFTLGWLGHAQLRQQDIQVQTTPLLPIGARCSYNASKAHVGAMRVQFGA